MASSKEALMLKDYLRDDLGSCSSNGFRSFPRRQCCSTVRFLLQIDLMEEPVLHRSRSKRASLTTLSAFQRVVNAVKQLSFPSVKSSSSQNRRRRDHLRHGSRSLKLLRATFWKKLPGEEQPEIERWRSFKYFLEEKSLDQNISTSDAVIGNRVSTSTCCCTNSWPENEFTTDNSVFPRGNSVSSDTSKRKISPKEWSSEEEKEQFSPVSVLDCPFQEDEEETSSSSQCSLVGFQGKKQQLMQKIRRVEDLPQLKPLDLHQHFQISELEEEEEEEEEEAQLFTQPFIISRETLIDDKAVEFLSLTMAKSSMNSFVSTSENLLLDFFREKMEETGSSRSEKEILKAAEDWVNGFPAEVRRGWEVEEGREAYGREMEEGQRWRKFDGEEEEEGMEMADQVWSGLLDELLVDLF